MKEYKLYECEKVPVVTLNHQLNYFLFYFVGLGICVECPTLASCRSVGGHVENGGFVKGIRKTMRA